MSERLSTIRQLELMRDFQRLANERWEEETRIRTALADGLREADERRDTTARNIEKRYAAGRERATAEHDRASSAARQEYEQERDSAQTEYKGVRRDVESKHSRQTRAAQIDQLETSWEALTMFDAFKGKPRERFLETSGRLRQRVEELQVLENDATTIMKMRRQWREFPPVESSDGNKGGEATDSSSEEAADTRWSTLEKKVVPGDAVEQAVGRVDALTTAVREEALALYQQRLPRLFEGGYPLGVWLLLWLVVAVPCGLLWGFAGWEWLAASGGLATAATAGVLGWLWPKARQQSGAQFQQVRRTLACARAAVDTAIEEAKARSNREMQALARERDQKLAAVDERLHATVDQTERWREQEMSRVGEVYPSRLAELRGNLDAALAAAESSFNEALAALAEERDQTAAENRAAYERRCRELQAQHDEDWATLVVRWREGMAKLDTAWDDIQTQCDRLFPDWSATTYDAWQRPEGIPTAIQFGHVTLDLAKIKHGIPEDAAIRPAETVVEMPALMTLAEQPVMLLSAQDEGRRQAVELMQLVMLRMLTALPPGRVRFTILDPVGLGESFASFMHLADFDENLVASRIWSESGQIEEQLTRLTAHMEMVLQKYLRNEFATIHEYNAQAGEVAEPFQVLVVANFPANFTESAARKLVSIITSGPRCGVYTLMSLDRKQRLPTDFPMDDVMAQAVHLDWAPEGEKFRWRYPAFEHLPLALDAPPPAERFNDVVRAAGRDAKDSIRVEVPFEIVAPPPERLWTGDSGKELVVPIGRAGAMQLQSVRLGKGTSQHLLVCGKTGSGKSTFLHALVTNAALHYSPREVEFYLVDFKKGVEFKTYATHHLPHARVVAIESEREFGLSVLERLDGELRRRGDLFRAAGVQDLPGFRAHVAESLRNSESAASERLPHVESMPRVLLVIDEFQELFVEDDKLAQEAALLLDRLVRQGRAFGIHVLLGSQTLGGAYSLARSTMGQMAVRVALQCSEADASMILSDERNTAARYLSRPGEAIYNDQNGLLTGNHPFQVVWLPEPQRIEYLRQVEEKSKEPGARSQGAGGRGMIVFEGNQPADPAENRPLGEALDGGAPEKLPVQRAWLGAAVAIKEPTFAAFSSHAGNNLLVVGGGEEMALGVLANAVISLAAQNRSDCGFRNAECGIEGPTPHSAFRIPQFVILDGSRPDSPLVDSWQRVADALPHRTTVAGARDVAAAIGEVAAELARRETAGREEVPPIYLVIYNGGRFRELRRAEDDFSFSSAADKPPQPDKQWSEILRNGPAWGIHSLVWCDSYNNVTRMIDRILMREFEMRVAFQMSAADSTSLLDTPAAGRLSLHRGLFYSEDVGSLEKFRPYEPPGDEWLARVRRAFSETAAKS